MKCVKQRFARIATTPPAATPAPFPPDPSRAEPVRPDPRCAAPTSRGPRAGPRRPSAQTTRFTMPSFLNRRPIPAATQLPRLRGPIPLRPRNHQPQQRLSSEVHSSPRPPPQSRPSWRPKAGRGTPTGVARRGTARSGLGAVPVARVVRGADERSTRGRCAATLALALKLAPGS
jgi:hypothetical protein